MDQVHRRTYPRRGTGASMPSELQSVGFGNDARLRVRLLGAAEVILDGRRLSVFDAPRLQRFLAMIALSDAPQSRTSLAYALWPDSSERQARTNLRKLLHEFRRALPDSEEFVDVEGNAVRWRSDALRAVDALSFREAIASGDFERAARLYKGDLLPTCYDDWVLKEREDLRSEALGVYRRLAEGAVARVDHQAAIRYAQTISDMEPADEAAARIQIEAHRALGDIAAAMRAADRYCAYVQEELGVAPDPEFDALRRETRARDSDQPPEPDLDAAVGRSPFVGRNSEWDALLSAWRTVCAGRAHVALLTGEPGIGKSRLAQELARSVRAEGHAVSEARAYEAAGRLPWGPVVDVLRSARFQDRIGALDETWIAEIARLLPEFGERRAQSSHSRHDQVAQRHRLFEAVCRAIATCDGPQLLVIDDLQWCDPETVELLGYLVRSHRDVPALIVGTARWEELPERHALPGVVDALQHDQAVTIVPLDPLDDISTAALAAELRGEDTLDAVLAERLWNETEGNPLFVVETIRAGLSADGERSALTPTMRAVLRARLGQMSAQAQKLAELAAVFGRPFSLTAMAKAAAGDEQEVADHLDELWRRRIVIDQGRSFDFSHDKLREVALEMINPARRRRLHKVVAEAIVHEYGDKTDAVSAQLAAHYEMAGLIEQAIVAYRTAGARAAAISGLEEAVSMFRKALLLLAELPNAPEREAVELDLRIAMGSPLVAIEGYGSDASLQLYERAMSLCRKLGRPVEPPILRGLGLARVQGCQFDDSSAFAQALIDHESKDRVSGTEGRYLLGVSAFWQGDLDKSRRYLNAATEHYDVARRDEHLALYAQDPKAICLIRLALTTLWSGDPARARTMARDAVEIADDLDHLMTSAYVATYGAILAAEAEDFVWLIDLLTQSDRIWSRLSERYLKVVLEALRGWLVVREGSDAGIEQIVESVARSRSQNESLHLSYTLLLLARARGLLGEWHEAHAATREALAWSERRNQRYLVAELLRVDGECAYNLGEAEDAKTALRQSVDVARAQGTDWLMLRALCSLASRFPDPSVQAELADHLGRLPSGHDLPAFQAATVLLRRSG